MGDEDAYDNNSTQDGSNSQGQCVCHIGLSLLTYQYQDFYFYINNKDGVLFMFLLY